jgi:hypothetical protein
LFITLYVLVSHAFLPLSQIRGVHRLFPFFFSSEYTYTHIGVCFWYSIAFPRLLLRATSSRTHTNTHCCSVLYCVRKPTRALVISWLLFLFLLSGFTRPTTALLPLVNPASSHSLRFTSPLVLFFLPPHFSCCVLSFVASFTYITHHKSAHRRAY